MISHLKDICMILVSFDQVDSCCLYNTSVLAWGALERPVVKSDSFVTPVHFAIEFPANFNVAGDERQVGIC